MLKVWVRQRRAVSDVQRLVWFLSKVLFFLTSTSDRATRRPCGARRKHDHSGIMSEHIKPEHHPSPQISTIPMSQPQLLLSTAVASLVSPSSHYSLLLCPIRIMPASDWKRNIQPRANLHFHKLISKSPNRSASPVRRPLEYPLP